MTVRRCHAPKVFGDQSSVAQEPPLTLGKKPLKRQIKVFERQFTAFRFFEYLSHF
ncbi:hypothetical protein PISMIDRAFT_18791 [Pisolithus microcarpus 441]|uniref:Uncharacterized protein n=1 Tax=Pisolithus microcarpus 441 TaxID=765257 RepID=A0A0C9YPR7_9AGAM|nr:hypothetical protein PISMIDRAFT_18791 [Pisolithus microcarpus 441]